MITPIRFTGLALVSVCLLFPAALPAQQWLHDDGSNTNQSIFRQVEDYPAPNRYRNAAGAPGPDYWQQQVDYKIEASLDTTSHSITGSERITYHNNSPDQLTYLWVQLDQNVRSIENSRSYESAAALPENISPQFRQFVGVDPFDGGYTISRVELVEDGRPSPAEYRINDTIMKVKLSTPLAPGQVQQLEIDWSYPIPDNGRGAKEKVSDGWLYEIAQWFPRMSVYDDVNGWQTDQFLGSGEFYLNFGNYDVSLTATSPTDESVRKRGSGIHHRTRGSNDS